MKRLFALSLAVCLLLCACGADPEPETTPITLPTEAQFRKAMMKYTREDSVIVISTHQVRDLETIIDPIIILDKQDVLLNATVEKISEKLYFDYAVEYINNSISSPVTVEELCLRLGISQAYLYRTFKNHVGCSPKQYILQAKLLQAQLLLRESSLSVSEVGSAVGFTDALAFSRFFSARAGCSPSEYRRKN